MPIRTILAFEAGKRFGLNPRITIAIFDDTATELVCADTGYVETVIAGFAVVLSVYAGCVEPSSFVASEARYTLDQTRITVFAIATVVSSVQIGRASCRERV